MPKQQTFAPCLVPEPRLMELKGGALTLAPDKLIVLSAATPHDVFFEAQETQRALSKYAGLTWHIHAGTAPADQVGLTIEIETCEDDPNPNEIEQQGYWLNVYAEGIHIIALAPAGVLNAVMTLTQLLRQYGSTLPLLHIEDKPDFARRGIMLDVSRDKVPTMATLFDLIDMLAELKLNELQL